jgi:hypothetical protein
MKCQTCMITSRHFFEGSFAGGGGALGGRKGAVGALPVLWMAA